METDEDQPHIMENYMYEDELYDREPQSSLILVTREHFTACITSLVY